MTGRTSGTWWGPAWHWWGCASAGSGREKPTQQQELAAADGVDEVVDAEVLSNKCPPPVAHTSCFMAGRAGQAGRHLCGSED
jgi:hypothetical protein